MFIFNKFRTGIKKGICSAINSKSIIRFDYHDGTQLVEPYCLGVLPGSGDNVSLRCYQISGQSKFDSPDGWKLYRLSDISNLETTENHFAGTRPEYDPDNSEMETVYCAITLKRKAASQTKQAAGFNYQSERTITDNPCPEKEMPPVLNHNELMRRFRFSHIKFPSRLFRNKNQGGNSLLPKGTFSIGQDDELV